MSKRQQMISSDLYCTECGFKMIIPRKRASLREENHIKDLYCPKCGRVTKFEETNKDENIQYWEDFQKSFE